jgi:hypothetical protein
VLLGCSACYSLLDIRVIWCCFEAWGFIFGVSIDVRAVGLAKGSSRLVRNFSVAQNKPVNCVIWQTRQVVFNEWRPNDSLLLNGHVELFFRLSEISEIERFVVPMFDGTRACFFVSVLIY